MAPDGFSIVIPASWKVPEARAAPTTDRKKGERGLRATRATVAEILDSGAELPAPLFRATSRDKAETSGVTVGAYNVGVSDDLESLRDAIRQAVPGHVEMTEVAVARITGLEVIRPAVETSDGGTLLYTTDLWVAVPHSPRRFAVLRFWRIGSSWDDAAAALGSAIADTFLFLLPVQFRGRLNRWVLRRERYFEPPDRQDLSAPAADGWRAAGWRLGVVFHTAQLSEKKLMFFTFTERPKDAFLGAGVFVAWIVIVYAFLADHTEGSGDWVFYAGSGPITGWAKGLRDGRGSMLGLLGTLGATLGLGFALG
jgi:hypothetical protein